VDGLFVPLLLEGAASGLGDAAALDIDGTHLAITTDAFVVTPVVFPGGSIGELAVNGTVNDLAVAGADAVALVASFVLEAGLPSAVLDAEVRAMARTARAAGVPIVGGDTKVVEHGKTDRMYITTSGIGRRMPGVNVDPRSVRPGDRILLSGPIGDHGITILLARGELDLEAELRSDTRSVLPLVQAMVAVAAGGIRWMRDPTRGGVATSARTRCPYATKCEAHASSSASIRCTSPTRVSSLRSSPRMTPMPRSTRSGPRPAAKAPC